MSRSFKPVVTCTRFNDEGWGILTRGYFTNGKVYHKRRTAKKGRLAAKDEILDQMDDHREFLEEMTAEQDDWMLELEMREYQWEHTMRFLEEFGEENPYDNDPLLDSDYDSDDGWDQKMEDYADLYEEEQFADPYVCVGPEYRLGFSLEPRCPTCGKPLENH